MARNWDLGLVVVIWEWLREELWSLRNSILHNFKSTRKTRLLYPRFSEFVSLQPCECGECCGLGLVVHHLVLRHIMQNLKVVA